MASRLWLSLCLVLFAHNLFELVSDRHQLSSIVAALQPSNAQA